MAEKDYEAEKADKNAQEKGLAEMDDDAALALLSGDFDRSSFGSPKDEQKKEPAQQKPAEEQKAEREEAEEPSEDEEEESSIEYLEFDPETLELKPPKKDKKSSKEHQSKDESSMDAEERRRMWQSKYDKEHAERLRLEARIAELEQKIAELSSSKPPEGRTSPASEPVEFDKTPEDFMPKGLEYSAYEAVDPSTPSGRAYALWQQERERHLREQIRRDVLNSVLAEQQREKQRSMLEAQINYLRRKTGMSDDEIRQLIEEAAVPREDQLYILKLALDISKGRLPLSKKSLVQIAEAYKPNGGMPSAASLPSSSGKQAPKVPAELAIFSDFNNAVL